MKNRWGLEEGEPKKLEEGDLTFDGESGLICIVKQCDRCGRLLVVRWTSGTITKAVTCSGCGRDCDRK